MRQRRGNFLKCDERGHLVDVGDTRATEKTCQALRKEMKIREYEAPETQHNESNNDNITTAPPLFAPLNSMHDTLFACLGHK